MLGDATRQLLAQYPRIFFACHTRHVRDPETQREVSAHQASILDHLDTDTPTTVGELARHMGVSPSTMSLALSRLERGGWVARRPDPEDGRRVGVIVTAAGARIREAQSVLEPDRVRLLLSQLSAKERGRALEGLALLAGAAEKVMHGKQLYGLERRARGTRRP